MARKVIQDGAQGKGPSREVNHRLVSAVSPWFYANNWDHLIVNDGYVRMLLVSGYKSTEELGWGEAFRGLGGLNAPVSLIMRGIERAELRAELARTVNEAGAWRAEDVNSTFFDQMERDFEAEQSQEAADMIIRSNAAIFETYLYLGIRAETVEELHERSRKARSTVRGEHKECDAFFANQDQMFFAASPFMCRDRYSESFCNWAMPSTTIAEALLNQEGGICDPSGIPLGHDGLMSEVRIDPTVTGIGRPNRNMFLSGESGSGKTTVVRRLITHYRVLYDFDVIVNDVDDEYGAQTDALGGVSVSFNRASAMLLDPFIPRNIGGAEDDGGDDGAPDDVRRARAEARQAKVLSSHLPFLKTFLCMAFSIEGDAADLLKMACELAYNRAGVGNDMTFAEYESSGTGRPGMRDLYEMVIELKELMPEHRRALTSLELKLRSAAVGYDRHIWEAAGDGMPDAKLVRLNLQSLSEDPAMLAAQYYNLFTWEWSQIRSNRYSDRTVVLVFDEVHKVVNRSNVSAAYMLKDMVHRARKYGAIIVTSTQMIMDLLHKDIRDAGTGIVNNSAIQLFGTTNGDLDSKEENNLKSTRAFLKAEDDVVKKLGDPKRGRFIARVGDQKCWLHTYPPSDWESELFGGGSGR